MSTVNANIAAGDTVKLSDGTYATGIRITQTGTLANPMVILGNPADSSAVQVASYQAISTAPPKSGDYTHLRWLTITGAFEMGSETSGPGSITVMPIGVQVVKCRIEDADFPVVGGSLLLDSLMCPNAYRLDMDQNSTFVTYSNDVTVKNSVFTGTYSGSGDYQALKLRRMQNFTFFNNTMTTTSTQSSGYTFAIELYLSNNCLFQNNRITFTNNSSAGTDMVISTRDTSNRIRWVGNTITSNGSTACGIRISHNGSHDGASFKHAWIGNVIKIGNPDGNGAFRWEVDSDDDTLMFNVIASGNTQPALSQHSGNDLTDALIRHNTFFSSGAQVVSLNGNSTSGCKWVGNLAYSTAANSAAAGSATVRLLESIAADSMGTIYTPGGSSGNALYRSTSGLGTPGSGGAFGVSGKAVWGSPRFVDSTYATFDAGISSTGYARNPTSPCLQDGFSGAFSDASGGSGDVTPPAVSTLGGSTGRETILLGWLAPADDSSFACSGSASAYDLRYSTSAINSGNFEGASPVSGTPSPSTPGSEECVLLQGLSDCTTYYFAIKTRDDAGNWSLLSNVKSLTTKCSGALTLECGSGKSGLRSPGDARSKWTLGLGRATPNPARDGATMLVSIPDHLAGQRLEVSVFDLSGRRVALLAEGLAVVGERALTWDLRDRSGSLVRPGLYLARLRIAQEVRTQSVIVGQ